MLIWRASCQELPVIALAAACLLRPCKHRRIRTRGPGPGLQFGLQNFSGRQQEQERFCTPCQPAQGRQRGRPAAAARTGAAGAAAPCPGPISENAPRAPAERPLRPASGTAQRQGGVDRFRQQQPQARSSAGSLINSAASSGNCCLTRYRNCVYDAGASRCTDSQSYCTSCAISYLLQVPARQVTPAKLAAAVGIVQRVQLRRHRRLGDIRQKAVLHAAVQLEDDEYNTGLCKHR